MVIIITASPQVLYYCNQFCQLPGGNEYQRAAGGDAATNIRPFGSVPPKPEIKISELLHFRSIRSCSIDVPADIVSLPHRHYSTDLYDAL